MNTSMNLQRISVDRLKPAKYNPRKDLKPGDPAYEKIRRSLHEFGYVDPVIWNEVTGNIVGGHQRYKVLTAEGATEIDCVVVHIENPAPKNFFQSETVCLILIQVIVEQRGNHVVCRGDRVKITRKMEVDLIHRKHLCISSSGSSPLHPEARA